ncbi:TPA: hypothetical protein ACU9OW_003120 [Legionella pneumophila]
MRHHRISWCVSQCATASWWHIGAGIACLADITIQGGSCEIGGDVGSSHLRRGVVNRELPRWAINREC